MTADANIRPVMNRPVVQTGHGPLRGVLASEPPEQDRRGDGRPGRGVRVPREGAHGVARAVQPLDGFAVAGDLLGQLRQGIVLREDADDGAAGAVLRDERRRHASDADLDLDQILVGLQGEGLGEGGFSVLAAYTWSHSIDTGSSDSSGHWLILSPTLSRDFLIHTNWILSLHGEGQWASEPLISNEQYGLGGVNSVRGYEEGEVFGDTGWWLGIEQKTPPHVVGLVYRNHPLTVRATAFMEYGEVYLLDAQGRQDRTPLWGTGFGGVASIGATWEARLLLSWPLLSAGTTHAGVPRLNFSLGAQF